MPTTTHPNIGSVDGSRVRKYREALGWSQQDLAVEAGVHSSTVSKLEQSGERVLQSDVLARLARALGVRIDDLVVRV